MSTFSAAKYDASNYSKHRPTYPPSLYEYIRTYTELPEGKKLPIVVDLACGPGEATVDLAKSLGEKVFGVDPSEVMLAQAREKVKPYEAQIDLIVGGDDTLDAHFASHTVDLLCVAEAAHWFTYPDFWHTAHNLLKPGGTLALWAYYFFHIEGHPFIAEAVRDFSLSPQKCGPYWGAGQSRLNTLYSDLEVPSTLFESEKRYICGGQSQSGPFQIVRKETPLGEVLSLLSTYSAYHSWKEANPDKEDILDKAIQEMLEKTGLTLDSKVTAHWETVLICAKSKQTS